MKFKSTQMNLKILEQTRELAVYLSIFNSFMNTRKKAKDESIEYFTQSINNNYIIHTHRHLEEIIKRCKSLLESLSKVTLGGKVRFHNENMSFNTTLKELLEIESIEDPIAKFDKTVENSKNIISELGLKFAKYIPEFDNEYDSGHFKNADDLNDMICYFIRLLNLSMCDPIEAISDNMKMIKKYS